jgi:hypothetical protein
VTSKRKADALNTVYADAAQTTADMADLLRSKLLAVSNKKRCQTTKRPTITHEQVGSSCFNKLPHELREKVYGYFWEETPRFRQRYKRCYYTVSYGGQDEVTEQEHLQVCDSLLTIVVTMC